MYKETTLHSFEVHQKVATLLHFISFIWLYVYSYQQVNDEKLCKGSRGCAYGAGAGVIFPRYSVS